MDGTRFDAIVRALASGSTRRGWVRAALGVLLGSGAAATRDSRAKAQPAGVPLGGECLETSDCAQYPGPASPAVCADNGVADDGPLNCCVARPGDCCAVDADCCGDLGCAPTGDEICGSRCAERPFGTGLLGEPCQSVEQCAQLRYGEVYCGDNGLVDDGPLTCCRVDSGVCRAHAECCAGFDCLPGPVLYGRVCQTPDAPYAVRQVAEDANLRAEPHPDAAVLTVIPAGESVRLTGEDGAGEYLAVEYAGVRGFVSATLLVL